MALARELHVTQMPFVLVAGDLLALGLAFYPNETPDDLARTVALLRKFVRDGLLAGIAPPRGEAGTCDVEQARAIAAQLRQARQSVEGLGIGARQAEAKYGFPNANIYNWHSAGWVRITMIEDGNKLFNEGDIAVARVIADLIGQRPGKAIFPHRTPAGRPPKKR